MDVVLPYGYWNLVLASMPPKHHSIQHCYVNPTQNFRGPQETQMDTQNHLKTHWNSWEKHPNLNLNFPTIMKQFIMTKSLKHLNLQIRKYWYTLCCGELKLSRKNSNSDWFILNYCFNHHRLNGSSSSVLTATSLSRESQKFDPPQNQNPWPD